MYYFDQPVKYVDKNGNIKDKKTTVTNVIDKAEYSADYGFVTSDNDIKTYFPKKLGSKGVLLEYQDIKIEVSPLSLKKSISTESSAQKKQKQIDSQIRDSVEYIKAFGDNTTLKYTPTLNGFKEDIILSAYTGENRFSFKIKTNGLSLVCEDGVYYLVDPTTDEKVMQVGNIIVYDSSMTPNTTPSTPDLNPVKPEPQELTEEEKNALYFPEGHLDPIYEHYYQLETVKETEEYILTIVVDEDYLLCEDTVYPVTIDPSLTVAGSSFEDATIYTNYTSNQGYSLNMFVGDYTARYGGTKGVARTLIRFPGLFSNSTFSSLTANNIISVDFMLRDTMCEGDAVWIDCYRMNRSWSESNAVYSSSLWNGYTGNCVDDQYVQYNGGTGSNGTGTGHWYHFDLTAVVKEWMNGYYGGTSNHYGIMLKAYIETDSAKTFGTSDNANYPPKLVIDYDSGNHGALPISAVHFSQEEYVVPVGWTGTFDVTVSPEGAVAEDLIWLLVGTHDIATITDDGVFTALAEGTKELVVGATNGGSGDCCTITIVNPNNIEYVDITKDNSGKYSIFVTKFYNGDFYFQGYGSEKNEWGDLYSLSQTNIDWLNETYNDYVEYRANNNGMLNPLHVGHAAYLAREKLINTLEVGTWNVDINSDEFYGLWMHYTRFEEAYQEVIQLTAQAVETAAIVGATIYQGVMLVKNVYTLANQRVFINATTYNSAIKASDSFSSLSDTQAINEGITDTSSYSSGRPTWRQSEINASQYYPSNSGYEYNKSYKVINGTLTEVSYGTTGSVRPDYYNPSTKHCVDIKNYNIQTATGRNNLANNVINQYNQRVSVFPTGTKFEVRIDITGQSWTQSILDAIASAIETGTGGNMTVAFMGT